MKPGPLLIRADANVSIGTGHIMRCLALAEAWQDVGGTAALLFAEMPRPLEVRLNASRVSPLHSQVVPGSLGDAESTIAEVRRHNIDWLVVDGDHFRMDFLNRIHEAGIRLLLIDDFAKRENVQADLVVNPNFGADADLYAYRGTKVPVLSGSQYALLRREFQRLGEARVASDRVRVLLTFGGSDPENLTPKVAAALASVPGLQPTVVVGAGYPRAAELKELLASRMRVVVDSQDMAGLMEQSDLAVIAAGGVLWELLAMGCVVLSYARNAVQLRVVQALTDEGIIINMGGTSNFDGASLVEEIRRLVSSPSSLKEMVLRGRSLVDTHGAARVVEAMVRLGGRAGDRG